MTDFGVLTLERRDEVALLTLTALEIEPVV